MTRPLVWLADARIPDCGRCIDWLMDTPLLVGAVASVSIGGPVRPDVALRRAVEAFHANRHREG